MPEWQERKNKKMTNTIRTTKEVTDAIINYFKENEESFNDCILDLDSYNGYLNDDRYFEMYELNEFLQCKEPEEILKMSFYGYDEDNDTAFNPNKEYFKFNACGNLVSTDSIDYSSYLDDYFVEELEKYRNEIYSIENDEELSKLFDELEESEEC